MSTDDVYLYPDPASFAEVANKLLEVADYPKQVRTDSNGPFPLALVVPQEVYQRYVDLDASSAPEEPKKRGRPAARKDTAPESETP